MEKCDNRKCIQHELGIDNNCIQTNFVEECDLYEPLKEKTESVAEVPCSDRVSKPVGKLRLVDTKQIGDPSKNITRVEVFCRDEADNVFSFLADSFNHQMKAC